MTVSRGRWLAKKLARRGVSATMTHAISVKRSAEPRTAARALMYHRVGKSKRDPWCVSTRSFEEQVRWVAEHGLAVSLEDVVAFAEGRGSVRDGAVLITSDDGYQCVATQMAPILHRYGVPGVAFVTTSRVGSHRRGGPEPFMSWDEVAELAALGVTVGSHAHTHSSLGQMPLRQAREEAARSRALLMSRSGVNVDSFAYPYGLQPDHNGSTRQMLEELGYRSAFTAMHGPIHRGTNPLAFPRIKVEGGEGLTMFTRLCTGAMDVWRLFDETGSRLQRPAR